MLLRWIVTILAFTAVVEACTRNCNRTETKVDIAYTRRVVGKFASYEEIMTWYQKLQKRYRKFVRLIDIGDSYEGRKQIVMRISSRKKNDRPAIFMEATMHAREWLAPATLNYIIYKMIRGYKRGIGRYRRAMDKYIFYFLSVSNPDGYVFSFDKSKRDNRYWRKNRRYHSNGCFGVDLNRNWNINFGGAGTSVDPCSNIYQGSRAFSEPETRNMRDFMLRKIGRGKLTLYISLHSYSQLWVVPWSYTAMVKPSNFREMKRAAIYASRAAQRATGAIYAVGNGAEVFGVTAAGSDDWTLRYMRANYSYTLECRPSERAVSGDWRQGFSPSPSVIPLSGREVLASLMALVDTMNRDW